MLLNKLIISGTEELWVYILLMPVIPSLFCTIVLVFMAESPRFLLLDKHNEQGAEKGRYGNRKFTKLNYNCKKSSGHPVSKNQKQLLALRTFK